MGRRQPLTLLPDNLVVLVAQAQLEGHVLVTDDARIRRFHDVRSTWA